MARRTWPMQGSPLGQSRISRPLTTKGVSALGSAEALLATGAGVPSEKFPEGDGPEISPLPLAPAALISVWLRAPGATSGIMSSSRGNSGNGSGGGMAGLAEASAVTGCLGRSVGVLRGPGALCAAGLGCTKRRTPEPTPPGGATSGHRADGFRAAHRASRAGRGNAETPAG